MRRCVAMVSGVLGLAVSACAPSRDPHAQAGHGAHEAAAASYKAGHGVRLSEAAATFAGLGLGGVETRDLPGLPGAMVVPAGAVLRTVRGAFVFVQNGAWLLRTPVILGATAPDWVEIKDGLYEGDTVAVAGVDALWLAEISAINGGVGCADGH